MYNKYGLFIDGNWRGRNDQDFMDVFNPATGAGFGAMQRCINKFWQ
jgi:acyl-CoA reductase-like NAD-dependent aldehyde dehydrogenase